jgi:hypothetical protein
LYSTSTSRLFSRKSDKATLEVNVLAREVKLVGVGEDVIDFLENGRAVLVFAIEGGPVPEKVVNLLLELNCLVDNFELAFFRQTDEHVENGLEVIVEVGDENLQVVENVGQNVQNKHGDLIGFVIALQTAIFLGEVAKHQREDYLRNALTDQLVDLSHQVLEGDQEKLDYVRRDVLVWLGHLSRS